MVTIDTQGSERDLLLISIFTFFTVTLWVFFEVLKSFKTTTISPTTTEIVQPLNSKLDIQTIELLSSKNYYE